MKCKICRKTITNSYPFCPFCGHALVHNNTFNKITTGNNSINVGVGNNGKQDVYIDNINYINDNNELVVRYSEHIDGKVIGGLNSFKRKFEITGFLSIISALVTLIDYFITESNYTFLFFLCGAAMLIYAVDNKQKYLDLKINGVFYKSKNPKLIDKDGDIYKIKKYGICPVCNGKVLIYYDNKFKRSLGKCENNNDHLYTYDHTIDAGVPYVVFDIYQAE
ncbi:hypothetical protein V9W62_19360 [Bacillus velezensis]|uniref:hypothetical protein n=1 Tax=Bacillus velezensis TaxID=492670 RepID=UPI0005B645E9|nr:hypothetical protein [Bacillus velezensis]AWK48156.1 hypothetical protein RZ52_19215 [Bacillus velezensis]